MNTRLAKVLVMLLVIAVLTITPLVSAQAGPAQLGLRPDAPKYAQHGPYWVGVIEHEAETPSHPTTVLVWYPALNPEGAEEVATYYNENLFPIAGRALRDAAPDSSGGPYPLVIYVHGFGGQRHNGNWLCEHLASHGFVTMSIDQIDGSATTHGEITPQMRVQDVSWQIDYADSLTSAEGVLAGMIDTSRVAVTGHSRGGLTALEAGGSGGDPRVVAVVPMAPESGVQELNTFTPPTLLLSGSRDEFLPVSTAHTIYETLGSSTKGLIIFELAHHSIFFNSCDAVPWALPANHLYCSDPVWDMDRVHDLANHFITAFLLKVLDGDVAAGQLLKVCATMGGLDGVECQFTGF